MQKFFTNGCLAVAALLAAGCNNRAGDQAAGNLADNTATADATAGGGMEEMGPTGGGGNLTTEPTTGMDGMGTGGVTGAGGGGNMSNGAAGTGAGGTGAGGTTPGS